MNVKQGQKSDTWS